ncbi:2012_t:CDS:2 [Cetraspora pellucida]|uniref:2012_t:CDS:1 n=1 Tax=Cetraspora pellucida TaxID=1433469 RepID=A0A9N8W2B6_9GLOM|nr:2012_t:CDS:2 [Cetraspora pellucida]
MAQQPESPRLSLSENQATIQNHRIQREINNIRQYFQSLKGDLQTQLATLQNNYNLLQQNLTQNDLLLADIHLDLKWIPLPNMATIQEVIAVVTSLIAPILQYISQEPPKDYVNKIKQLYNCSSIVSVVAAFNDAIKTQILASKMGGKYIPPNPFNNQAVVAVNTLALFLAWLNTKYQRNNIGTQQIATQRLTQEKFMLYDTSETYKTRIKPFLL